MKQVLSFLRSNAAGLIFIALGLQGDTFITVSPCVPLGPAPSPPPPITPCWWEGCLARWPETCCPPCGSA